MKAINLSKAKEIAKNIVCNDHYSYFDNFKQCALEAMRWKDEQFLQSLEELPQKNHAIYDLISNLKKAMEEQL